MINVGIIGGAGYTAGELMRILVGHPEANIVFVLSNSQKGRAVSEIHPDLTGELELDFVGEMSPEVDVIFLCSGHGKSKGFLKENPIAENIKIIDLSSDFRLKKDREGFVYGLPELNRDKIIQANKIANPGCFATAIQLALLPLAAHHELNEDLHVHALTGSTGAGQRPTPTTHFSWRNNNASIYKPFSHQHLGEIRESLTQLDPNFTIPISMIDNLIKGASGQAIQNMNLMFGLEETLGLRLKGSAF